MVNFNWEKYDNPANRVTLKNANTGYTMINKNDYKSALGDFSWLQERIVLFGQSRHMIFISILYTLSFILTALSITYMWEYGVPVLYSLLQITFSLLFTIGLLSITIGSLQVNKERIVRGFSIINLLVTIGFISIILGAVFIGAMLVLQLYVAFSSTIMLSIIVGLVFYFFIMFYKAILDFTRDCTFVVKTLPNNKVTKPDASTIRTYLSILFYLSLFQIVVSLFLFASHVNLSVNPLITVEPWGILLYSIFYSLLLLYFMYLCSTFNENLDYELFTKRKTEYYNSN